MAERQTVVVGSGIGGLVSALVLAHRGLAVTVVEQGSEAGGKLRTECIDGHALDTGPTVFTMRWVFDELMESVGEQLDQHLTLTPLPIIGRHFWRDGGTLDLHADAQASFEAVEVFAGGAEALRFQRYSAMARALYERLEGPFMRSGRPDLPRFMAAIGPRGLAMLAALGPLQSLWSSLGRNFKDARLRQLFARYATYCGSSPWQAPATLSLIAHVEMQGVWSVQGGMAALPRALTRLCQRAGVRFRYQSVCRRIMVRGGRVAGVDLGEGDQIAADAVIFNGDAAALRQGLLGPGAASALPKRQPMRSLSAVTWSMRGRTQGVQLDRHNIFFGHRYASEFEDIFERARLPAEPTVYVCAQDRGVSSPIADRERLFCLINAPAIGDVAPFSAMELDRSRDRCFDFLRACGLSLESESERIVCTSPHQFHLRYPGTGGSLYGQATHGWMSIFSRPGSTTRLPGLYLAGGSVHPGPGVPMAALSGRLAAEALMANRGSTSSSLRVGISGGMSMQPAMTVHTDSP